MKKMKAMRFLSLFSVLIFAATSSVAYGASIGGINLAATANNVLDSYGNFYNYDTPRPPYPSGVSPLPVSSGQLVSDLSDSSEATYVFSSTSGAFVDLDFSASNGIYNGAGGDLALFFVGDTGSPSVEINGTTINYAPVILPEPMTVSDSYGLYNLTMAMINLDDFGLAYNANVTSIRLDFNGKSTALSLAGSIYNTEQPATVPLPLPALLFASGLGALGLFGRSRRKQQG